MPGTEVIPTAAIFQAPFIVNMSYIFLPQSRATGNAQKTELVDPRGCQLLLELIAWWESNTLRSWSQQRLVHLLVSKLVSCCSRRTEVKQVLNSVVDKGSVENGLRKKKGGKK